LHHRFNDKVLDLQHQQTHHVVQVAVAETTDQLKEQEHVVMTAVTQLFKVVAVWVKVFLVVHKLQVHLKPQFKLQLADGTQQQLLES
jgi:hypothetical protein